MAPIDVRSKIKKEDKERLKEVSKQINKCIREKKRSRGHVHIQRILE